MKLFGAAPLPVRWRVIKNGVTVSESEGRTLDYAVDSAGIFRCEAWLTVANEEALWILSNPIYITAP